jgi:hypothetical protein
MNSWCMRALAMLLERPIITIQPRDLTMRVYPSSASRYRIVPQEGSSSRKLEAKYSDEYATPSVPEGKMSAMDVAFDPDALVLIYHQNHYFPTRLIDASQHNPVGLKESFLEGGNKIFRLERG